MSRKIEGENGEEVEVFTADEVAAKVKETETTVTTKLQGDFTKTKAELDKELSDAKKALGERAGEFKNFRKLNDEVIEKLSVAERTIYENQAAMAADREKREAAEKTAREKQVEAVIRSKVGTDDKLFGKVKDMYSIIGIEANTPEEMEKKTLAALGALQTTEPDLVAAALGVNGGSWAPPTMKKDEDKSFADTDRGRLGAKELGLELEPKKK